MAPPVTLRPMLREDGPVLGALFTLSIEELTADDYTPAQQAAWMSAADDEDAFAKRLAAMLTIVAVRAGEIVGFASLKLPGHLEMLFVRPDVARQGIATTLVDALGKLAAARGAKEITVDASDTAQPFFSRQGYEALRRETVPRGDEWLGRTVMRKVLGAPAPDGRR